MPASSPHSTGGVAQRPSFSTKTLLMAPSVTSPRTFRNSTSSKPAAAAWANAGRVKRAMRGLVVKHRVGRIGALRCEAHARYAVRLAAWRQNFARDLEMALRIEEQPHLARHTFCKLPRVLFKRCAYLIAVAGKSEILRRIREPVEVQLDQRDTRRPRAKSR